MSELKKPLESATQLISPVLPQDQYLHDTHMEQSSEWWWHTGTLRCKNTDRVFGFEINAATMYTGKFTQVALIDIENNVYYSKVTNALDYYEPQMAESDTSKDWWVYLPLSSVPGCEGGANVKMTASKSDVTNMEVTSDFEDQLTGKKCSFNLNFNQMDGKEPLFAWGTGAKNLYDPPPSHDMQLNNYYYSLTHLEASGTLEIEGEGEFEVEGITWMDHEYGAWKEAIKWVFQTALLDNGIHLSTYTLVPDIPRQNVSLPAAVTLLIDNESIYFEDNTQKGGDTLVTLTPLGTPIPHAGGRVNYFLEYQLDIDAGDYNASIVIQSLMDEQIFIWPDASKDADIYEGIATVVKERSTWGQDHISGVAWTEQNIEYSS